MTAVGIGQSPDRIAVGCDDDLEVLPAGIRLQVDVNRNPEQRLRLVRGLRQQAKDPRTQPGA